MGAVRLADIRVTTLKRISTPGGDVMHAMRRDDPGFVGFGEAYFSTVELGAIKAWKLHQFLTLNLVVPVGAVRFVFHLPDRPGEFRVEELGAERYCRLTAPPGIWFGFSGLTAANSLVLNIADLPHDPAEVLRRPVSDIAFNW